MRIFGMYGMGCKHDVSSIAFQAVFEHLQMLDVYQVMDIPPMALVGAIESLTRSEFAGVNILWPYQEYIMEICEDVLEDAVKANAANMVVASGEMVSACNTNTPGMLRAILEDGNFDPQGKQILLLGAGAAARCMALALSKTGAGRILLANRTKERAEENAALLTKNLGREIEACGWDDPNLADYMKDSQLVANCTFLGGYKKPDELPVPELLEYLHQGQLVVDVTQKPVKTPFLEKAEEQGTDTLPGYLITLYQCAETFKVWTTQDAPVDIMRTAIEKQLLQN